MVQFAGWDMPLVYEGSDKGRVAGGAGELSTTFCASCRPADHSLESHGTKEFHLPLSDPIRSRTA